MRNVASLLLALFLLSACEDDPPAPEEEIGLYPWIDGEQDEVGDEAPEPGDDAPEHPSDLPPED